MNAQRMLRCMAVLLTVVLSDIYSTAQTCHIITNSGPCSSINVVIPGISGTGSAVCTTTGLYGDTAGMEIGSIFLTVVASQTCSPDSGVMSVTQRASTAVDLNDTAIDGLRSSVVDDNGRTLFRSHGEEDCAKGPSETVEIDDPSACTPVPPPPPPPQPTPTPNCDPEAPQDLRSGTGSDNNPCASPIIIDTSGNGYRLTSAANGVLFDIAGTGTPMRLGWTQPGSGNAFLVLPGANGIVSTGQQLFGNFTPQPPSATPNGYAALAVYDQPDHGGNGDGVIDQKDEIFSSLRLWLDENHDGVCQPGELYRLPDLGVFSISLNYSLSHRVDGFGNVFRYRADVNSSISGESDVGRKAFDVFLTTQ